MIGDLLRFVGVATFFAQRMNRPGNIRRAGKLRYSPTIVDDIATTVEHLSEIYTVEFEMKFFAHAWA